MKKSVLSRLRGEGTGNGNEKGKETRRIREVGGEGTGKERRRRHGGMKRREGERKDRTRQ